MTSPSDPERVPSKKRRGRGSPTGVTTDINAIISIKDSLSRVTKIPRIGDRESRSRRPRPGMNSGETRFCLLPASSHLVFLASSASCSCSCPASRPSRGPGRQHRSRRSFPGSSTIRWGGPGKALEASITSPIWSADGPDKTAPTLPFIHRIPPADPSKPRGRQQPCPSEPTASGRPAAIA